MAKKLKAIVSQQIVVERLYNVVVEVDDEFDEEDHCHIRDTALDLVDWTQPYEEIFIDILEESVDEYEFV